VCVVKNLFHSLLPLWSGKMRLGSLGTSCLATQRRENPLRHPHRNLCPTRLVADRLTRQQRKAPRLNCDRLSQGSRRPNLAAIMPTTFIWKWAVLTRALIIWKSLLPSNDRRQTSAQTFKNKLWGLVQLQSDFTLFACTQNRRFMGLLFSIITFQIFFPPNKNCWLIPSKQRRLKELWISVWFLCNLAQRTADGQFSIRKLDEQSPWTKTPADAQ